MSVFVSGIVSEMASKIVSEMASNIVSEIVSKIVTFILHHYPSYWAAVCLDGVDCCVAGSKGQIKDIGCTLD